MHLLRIAIASLLLTAGTQLAQAADVSRMAVPPTHKQPSVRTPMAPDVTKTPVPARVFTPVPLPNSGPAIVGDKPPVPRAGKVSKVDSITIKQGTTGASHGNEPGTLKGVVSPRNRDGAVLLTPLDSPRPLKKQEASREASSDSR